MLLGAGASEGVAPGPWTPVRCLGLFQRTMVQALVWLKDWLCVTGVPHGQLVDTLLKRTQMTLVNDSISLHKYANLNYCIYQLL